MAHTHHCCYVTSSTTRKLDGGEDQVIEQKCNEVVAVCDDGHCQGDEGHYCSRHHPDPAHHVEDKPTVRMTVNIAKDKE